MTGAPDAVYAGGRITVRPGDCLASLEALPDASVDAVVTDPPYGLANTTPEQVAETIVRWVNGERDYMPGGAGFMGKAWDAFVPPVAVWDECLRVLKPGGHVLAFAGSRTVDLMTLGLRLAGFDIRDSIAWLYGSGFPKSLDVSKAIDKAGGVSPEAQAKVLRAARERANLTREDVAENVGCTVSSIRDWEEGRARTAGSAIEFITPSLAYRDKLADLLGYTADERRVTGARLDRRGDNTIIGLNHSGVEYGTASTESAQQWQGWGTALKPAFEPVVVARKPLEGTVAANVLAHGTGALNIDGCRVGDEERHNPSAGNASVVGMGTEQSMVAGETDGRATTGRWPANVVLDESQAVALDEQSGSLTSGANPAIRGGDTDQREVYGGFTGGRNEQPRRGTDSGGASRFFYVAKADASERPQVDGVAHPTVKPVALMRWLVRLVTPPGGLVLDPFGGSGTTAEACMAEGLRCLLFEREPSYLPLIDARLTQGPRRPPKPRKQVTDEHQESFLGVLYADDEEAS